jgi:LysM repeat protein
LVVANAGGGAGSNGSASSVRSADRPKHPYYVVRAGDTLSAIAAKEGVSEALITRLNPNLDPLGIQPRNCVDLIPHGCRALAAGGSSPGAGPAAGSPSGPKAPFYVVRTGDSLATIAAKEGVDLARVERLNPRHPDSIHPGDCIDLIRRACGQRAALKSSAKRLP